MATLELKRWSIEPVERNRRTLGDRLALRFPGATRRLASAILRRPLGSRVRSAMISFNLREGWAAANRGDYDRQFLQYAPGVEIDIEESGWWLVDVQRVHQGLAGARQLVDDLNVPMKQIRWEVREVVDAGDSRVACQLEVFAVGRASGLETRQEQWHVFLFDQGLVVRQRVFSTEDEALAALAEAGQVPRPASNQP